jgi:hypothetical protein
MINYKKIGEAAIWAYERPEAIETQTQLLEAVGRAAVAAMIPAADTDGTCPIQCPFLAGCEMVERKEVKPNTWYWFPGPSCPARKGGGA